MVKTTDISENYTHSPDPLCDSEARGRKFHCNVFNVSHFKMVLPAEDAVN